MTSQQGLACPERFIHMHWQTLSLCYCDVTRSEWLKAWAGPRMGGLEIKLPLTFFKIKLLVLFCDWGEGSLL